MRSRHQPLLGKMNNTETKNCLVYFKTMLHVKFPCSPQTSAEAPYYLRFRNQNILKNIQHFYIFEFFWNFFWNFLIILPIAPNSSAFISNKKKTKKKNSQTFIKSPFSLITLLLSFIQNNQHSYTASTTLTKSKW